MTDIRLVRRSDFAQAPTLILDLPNLIMVEGADDQRLVQRLLDLNNLNRVNVIDMGGKDTNWALYMETIAEDPAFRANVRNVGLVLDADTDAAPAFQRCAYALGKVPQFPLPAGCGQIAIDGGRRAGIYVMPNCTDAGNLETLMLSAGDPGRVARAVEYLDVLTADGFPAANNRSKSSIQAYMAGLAGAPKTLNVALRSSAWDLTAAAFSPFSGFLVGLFS